MNVTLFTHDGPIYMPKYLEPLFESHATKIDEVILAPPQRGFLQEVRLQLRIFGPKAFFIFGLMFIKGKILDIFPTNIIYNSTGRYYSVQSLAAEYDISVQEVEDVNDGSFIEYVRNQQPDLILSVACEQRLEEELLEIPAKGCVNIHGSLLPKYRGVMTSFWVLYHGESESGVTAHYMTPEFDAGEIILQRRYDIDPDDTMHDVYLKLVNEGAELAIEIIKRFSEENINTKPNNVEKGEYYTFPTKQERKEFLHRGNEFI